MRLIDLTETDVVRKQITLLGNVIRIPNFMLCDEKAKIQ